MTEQKHFEDEIRLTGQMADQRYLLERCLTHLDRMIDRYVPINAGDRMLAKAIREHLGK